MKQPIRLRDIVCNEIDGTYLNDEDVLDQESIEIEDE